MKKLSFMLVAVAAVAFSFTACKGGGNDPIVGPITCDTCSQVDPEPEPAEIPEVAAPEDGYVTIVLQIPAGSECNGIALKGTYDNAAWSGADTYLGEDGSVGPDACIKFEAIDGSKEWFKATYKLGAEGFIYCKICLIYAGDGSWEGQAKEMSIIEDYTTAEHNYAGDNLEILGSGLLYVNVAKWNKSECAEVVMKERHVVLIVPTNDCGFEVPSIVGSFNSWNATEFPMTAIEEGVKYEATVTADASDEFKFAGSVSGWDNEIRVYDAALDELKDNNPNIAFGDATEFELDYSTGKWKACAE